jgi:hypothetical protein
VEQVELVQASVTRSYISREEIEEISDEEAEWSDDFEPLGFSDSEFDLEAETDNPIKIFNPLRAELKPLQIFCSPTEPVYPTRVRSLSSPRDPGDGVSNLVRKLDGGPLEVDERWIDQLELLTSQLRE